MHGYEKENELGGDDDDDDDDDDVQQQCLCNLLPSYTVICDTHE
jgi:hypothetical protein